MTQSKLKWKNSGEPDATVSSLGLKKLVLDESRVPAERSLFLVKHIDYIIFMRDSLIKAIEAKGLTGISFLEISAYPPR